MSKLIDHTGKTFNDWKVIELAGRNPSGRPLWLCECVCGKRKKVIADNLVRGLSKSCGCVYLKKLSDQKTTHGKSNTRTYNIYLGMIDRCYNLNNKRYGNYGGRGIKVCDRWLESFENFLEDMGEKGKEYTLDRKDPKGNYSPDNCRWATRKQQCRNKNKRVDNKTGFTGVRFEDGSRYRAFWKELCGNERTKSFSIKKYGKEEAFNLACQAREEAIKRLNDQGAGYSENHGK